MDSQEIEKLAILFSVSDIVKNILIAIKYLGFSMFFESKTNKLPNKKQREMFFLSEGDGKLPNYERFSGASEFIVIYAQFKQIFGTRTIVIGSKYLRDLAKSILKDDREYPVVVHNSDFTSTHYFDLLIIDESHEILNTFRKNVIDKLSENKNMKVLEFTTN